MGFSLTFQHWFLYVMVLLPALCYSDPNDGFIETRASYYRTPDGLGTASGACGYGEYGRTVYDGKVTAVSAPIYNNGVGGCGSCYQIRCTNPRLCSANGVNVVVTDRGEGDRTDFILSARAFAAMARAGNGSQLFPYGTVDVEYKRIACQYPGHNIQVQVTKDSRNPNYLAFILLYKGGIGEILGIEIWQEDTQKWIAMSKSYGAYGAVFDMPNPPSGDLTLRFQVGGSAALEWVYASNVLPAYWKPGGTYDTNVQLS